MARVKLQPYTNEAGLRAYRPSVTADPVQSRRWPWLVLFAFLCGLLLAKVAR